SLGSGNGLNPQCVRLVSDGTNYQISPGAPSAAVAPSNYITGNWYNPMPQYRGNAGAAATADTIFCSFGYVTKNVVVNSLALHISATATGNTQLAIYSLSGGTLTLIDSTANIDTSSG